MCIIEALISIQAEQLRQHYMSKSNAEVAEAHQALQPVLQTIRELQRKAGTSYAFSL